MYNDNDWNEYEDEYSDEGDDGVKYIDAECTDVSITEGWIKNFSDWIVRNLNAEKDEMVLEVCAGRGILGRELDNRRVNIHITDNGTWRTDNIRAPGWDHCGDYIDDHLSAVEAVKLAKKTHQNVKFLLIGWPPGDDDTAYDAIKIFSEAFPDSKIIYIGTKNLKSNPKIASEAFYNHFKRLDDDDSILNNEDEEVTSIKSFKEEVADTYISNSDDEVQLGRFELCDEEDCPDRCKESFINVEKEEDDIDLLSSAQNFLSFDDDDYS